MISSSFHTGGVGISEEVFGTVFQELGIYIEKPLHLWSESHLRERGLLVCTPQVCSSCQGISVEVVLSVLLQHQDKKSRVNRVRKKVLRFIMKKIKRLR